MHHHLPSIFLSNVRCIRNKIDDILHKVGTLSPDVMLFCESWLSDMIPDDAINIPGYTVVRNDRNAFGGGLVSYFVNTLRFEVIESQAIPSLASTETEFSIFVLPDISMLLISLYHPVWNDPGKHEIGLSCVLDIIDYVLSSHLDAYKARIVICGDFNDLRLYNDKITQLTGLKQIVNFPTRKENTLDLIFTNISSTKHVRIFPPLGKSDHSCVFWSHDDKSLTQGVTCTKKTVRYMSKYNFMHFCSLMYDINWLNFVSSFSQLDVGFSEFLAALKALFDFCFPKRIVRMRSTDQPWVRPSLKLLCDDRDRAFSKGHMQKYYRLRNEVIKHVKYLKHSYLVHVMSKKDSRDSWRAIRIVSRMKNSSPTIPASFSADDFSTFFSSVFQKSQHPVDPPYSSQPATDAKLTVFEVQSQLTKLRRKGSAPGDIPYWIYRNFSFCLAPAITFLFNWSLKEGFVPLCLKSAIVTPIPKCSKPSALSDFRPISMLPLLSKVFEKLFARFWLLPFIQNKVQNTQYAYIPGPGSGTTCALTFAYNRIVKFLDSPGAVRVISIDFSKAFDKVTHKEILDALVRFEIPFFAVKWIASFLSGRQQCVRVGTDFSQWSPVSSGVPQGSVLGPILFCLVVDSIRTAHSNSMCIKYADDITILHFVRSNNDDHAQIEWNNIAEWASFHHLPINLNKCFVMDIVTKKCITLRPIFISDGFMLRNVKCVKLLGVTFADNMKWDVHVNNIVSKASRRLFILCNLVRSNSPIDVLVRVYNACIRSLVLYAYPVFCNCPKRLQNRLLAIERRAFRIIRSKPECDLLQEADSLCSRLFAAIESNPSHPLRDMFSSRAPTPRNQSSLKVPFGRTKRFTQSFIKFAHQ